MKTVPTISRVRFNLKKGKTGTFRMLKVGEEILASDVVITDTCYDFVSENNVGGKVEPLDTLIRLEFNE